jgi:hypothetical protein
MHPELLRALARARHEDLLTKRLNQGHPRVRRAADAPRPARCRQWLGSVLIWAGAHLIGDERAALEPAQK